MQAEPTKAEPPKRKRRWFQFSLRTLFVIVTVVAICCPFGARIIRDWQAQEQQHEIDEASRYFKESIGSYPGPIEQGVPSGTPTSQAGALTTVSSPAVKNLVRRLLAARNNPRMTESNANPVGRQ